MKPEELAELWVLLGQCGDERVYQLASLAVAQIRSDRAAMESLRDCLAACDEEDHAPEANHTTRAEQASARSIIPASPT